MADSQPLQTHGTPYKERCWSLERFSLGHVSFTWQMKPILERNTNRGKLTGLGLSQKQSTVPWTTINPSQWTAVIRKVNKSHSQHRASSLCFPAPRFEANTLISTSEGNNSQSSQEGFTECQALLCTSSSSTPGSGHGNTRSFQPKHAKHLC